MPGPSWEERAACREGTRWEVFAAAVGAPVASDAVQAAKRICTTECPVRAECLRDHIAERGVIGGYTERERKALLRQAALRHAG